VNSRGRPTAFEAGLPLGNFSESLERTIYSPSRRIEREKGFFMMNHTDGWMGGAMGGWMGGGMWLWTVIGVLVAVLLVVVIAKVSKK
jgi:hypothetical protein